MGKQDQTWWIAQTQPVAATDRKWLAMVRQTESFPRSLLGKYDEHVDLRPLRRVISQATPNQIAAYKEAAARVESPYNLGRQLTNAQCGALLSVTRHRHDSNVVNFRRLRRMLHPDPLAARYPGWLLSSPRLVCVKDTRAGTRKYRANYPVFRVDLDETIRTALQKANACGHAVVVTARGTATARVPHEQTRTECAIAIGFPGGFCLWAATRKGTGAANLATTASEGFGAWLREILRKHEPDVRPEPMGDLWGNAMWMLASKGHQDAADVLAAFTGGTSE